jgi:hypothetical protein
MTITTHKLAHELLKCNDVPLTISMDVSTCDENSGLRGFGTNFLGVNDYTAEEITLLFEGEINTNQAKTLKERASTLRKAVKMERNKEQSVAFKQGVKAAELGVPLEESGVVNLQPESDRYDEFIAGYDSVKKAD